MIPKYLLISKGGFTTPLPINTAVASKEESLADSKKRLEKIANDVTKALQFADHAGNYYSS